MKIEFHANDYMDIYRIQQGVDATITAAVEIGKIYKQNGKELTSLYNSKYLENVNFCDFMHLLGFSLDNIECEFGGYLWRKDAFIRIKKFQDTDVIYSFLENETGTEIASSTDFMGLILKEVFSKENNASL